MGARQEFWSAVLDVFDNDEDWSSRFASIDDLIRAADGGSELVLDDTHQGLTGATHGIGGPPSPQSPGYRSFMLSWSAHEKTSIHGHGRLMYVHAISAELGIDEFELNAENELEKGTQFTLRAGESIGRYVDNERKDNFIHSIACTTPGWTVHIYADDPAQGRTFSEDGGSQE